MKEINKRLSKTTDRKNLREFANVLNRIIKDRTRAGFGVKPPRKADSGGRRFKLPPFSDAYIEQRVRNARKLSKFASISRPNNTFTGQMLSDLRVNNISKDSFSIGFRSRKSRLKAEFLEIMGREFMHLSKKEIQILVKSYEKTLRRKTL